MIHDLLRQSISIDHNQLCLTVPYIVIANYITSLPHNSVADATQFMIMESFGIRSTKKPELIVVSAILGLK